MARGTPTTDFKFVLCLYVCVFIMVLPLARHFGSKVLLGIYQGLALVLTGGGFGLTLLASWGVRLVGSLSDSGGGS